MLWFGWFGFNAGSALAADGIAIQALLTTNTAAAAAMLSWMLIEKVLLGKPTIVGACTGAVVGLVAITPGAGFCFPLVILCDRGISESVLLLLYFGHQASLRSG